MGAGASSFEWKAKLMNHALGFGDGIDPRLIFFALLFGTGRAPDGTQIQGFRWAHDKDEHCQESESTSPFRNLGWMNLKHYNQVLFKKASF